MAIGTTKKEQIIEIAPIKRVRTQITIVGETPLIVHAWSEKAKRQMLESQMKVAKTKKAREAKDPFADFVGSLYWIAGKPDEVTPDSFEEAIASGKAKFGFRADAVKKAAIAGAYRSGMIPNMAIMRGVFFLNGTEDPELGTIIGSAPESREDMVRIGSAMTSTTDLRYRAVFDEWKIPLELEFNDNGMFSLSDVINAINVGGFVCGLGEWRAERDGRFGKFHVEMNDTNAEG